MTQTSLKLLAVDLGAESGRAILGAFDGERISLSEVHRFPNSPGACRTACTGMCCACSARSARASRWPPSNRRRGWPRWASIPGGWISRCWTGAAGCWATLTTTATRAQTAWWRPPASVGREAIFEQTGIQFMQLNTLYQLLVEGAHDSPLPAAHTLLTMPDLFNYWLTGRRCASFQTRPPRSATIRAGGPGRAPCCSGWASPIDLPAHRAAGDGAGRPARRRGGGSRAGRTWR